MFPSLATTTSTTAITLLQGHVPQRATQRQRPSLAHVHHGARSQEIVDFARYLGMDPV